MRAKLLEFMDECGSFEVATRRLKTNSTTLGNMVMGYVPVSPAIEIRLAAATDISSSGRVALHAWMKTRGVDDMDQAAALLGVSESYLRQQSSMREPTGAVMAQIRRELRNAADPQLHTVAETLALARAMVKQGTPLAEAVAKLAAQGRPMPGEYVGIAAHAARPESVEAHNARVLAERKERTPQPVAGASAVVPERRASKPAVARSRRV